MILSSIPVGLPWFQRFIFIISIAKGRGKINLWLKAAIDSSSRANQFELGSDPDGNIVIRKEMRRKLYFML
jgi:hypothetical protein